MIKTEVLFHEPGNLSDERAIYKSGDSLSQCSGKREVGRAGRSGCTVGYISFARPAKGNSLLFEILLTLLCFERHELGPVCFRSLSAFLFVCNLWHCSLCKISLIKVKVVIWPSSGSAEE